MSTELKGSSCTEYTVIRFEIGLITFNIKEFREKF